MSEVSTAAPEQIPLMTSPEWTNYVLSKFEPDELYEDSPKVDGLWRVTELLLGEISNYSITVIESPSEKNGFCSTVQCRITIERHGDNKILISSGVGDCNPRNADSTYGRFASSFAETRAKGRALRTMLRLRNIVAHEEKDGENPEILDGLEEPITVVQQESIDVLCHKMDLNLVRLCVAVANDVGFKITNFRTISKAVAAKILQRLNTYQKDKKLIDESLKGYVKNWKEVK